MITTRVEALSTTREVLVSSSGLDANLPRTVYLKGGTAEDIYVGGSDVTAANGYPVGSGAVTILLGPGDDLYAIAGAGTPSINVMVTRA